ncbi:Nucleolar protein 16 [Dinochytrium kinnereticum]|nr:Nucleolar protein 16 [Dinochytrium kinnereticum]
MGLSKRKRVKNPGMKVRRRTKNPYKISFANVPDVIRQNWDQKLTLRQNYERLGLVSELNGKAGGEAEMKRTLPADDSEEEGGDDDFKIEYRTFEEFEEMDTVSKKDSASASSFITKEEEEFGIEGPLKVEAKANIIGRKVSTLLKDSQKEPTKYPVTSTKRKPKPVITSVIEELKAGAALDAPTDRHVSDQELMHLANLQEKYGENYDAMARDRKLNVYQLTAGQLKRKFARSVKPQPKTTETEESS